MPGFESHVPHANHSPALRVQSTNRDCSPSTMNCGLHVRSAHNHRSVASLGAESEEVVKPFVGILLDQINHSLEIWI